MKFEHDGNGTSSNGKKEKGYSALEMLNERLGEMENHGKSNKKDEH